MKDGVVRSVILFFLHIFPHLKSIIFVARVFSNKCWVLTNFGWNFNSVPEKPNVVFPPLCWVYRFACERFSKPVHPAFLRAYVCFHTHTPFF